MFLKQSSTPQHYVMNVIYKQSHWETTASDWQTISHHWCRWYWNYCRLDATVSGRVAFTFSLGGSTSYGVLVLAGAGMLIGKGLLLLACGPLLLLRCLLFLLKTRPSSVLTSYDLIRSDEGLTLETSAPPFYLAVA